MTQWTQWTRWTEWTRWTGALLVAALVFGACSDDQDLGSDALTSLPGGSVGDELPVGSVTGEKADGSWGSATECKKLPEVEPLRDPEIVISLNGLTLHLRDRAGDYDRVFPIGVGAIEDGRSLTPVSDNAAGGIFRTRTDEAPTFDGPTPDQGRWGWNQECRVWWTSAETGKKLPVFAGLPFIRLTGPSSAAYGIHGPIDSYHLPSGGNLRRGYVSHGCVRMAAADIGEVYGRIQGHSAPVTIQQAIERSDAGVAVDTGAPWISTECGSDDDCAFEGGTCRSNPYTGRGFCTTACDLFCKDLPGHPPTFCVADPNGADGAGMCVTQAHALNNDCARYESLKLNADVARNGNPGSVRDVCMPAGARWIGDRCLDGNDCDSRDCRGLVGEALAVGICTEACERYCPDRAGAASTLCVSDPEDATTGRCLARCSSAAECPLGTTCEDEPRFGQPEVVHGVCLPE